MFTRQVTTAVDETLDIEVTQGRRYQMTITALLCNVSLQFKHLQDPTWYNLPGFTGTPSGTVVQADFLCPSATMRLVLATPSLHEEDPYYVSVTPHTTSEY